MWSKHVFLLLVYIEVVFQGFVFSTKLSNNIAREDILFISYYLYNAEGVSGPFTSGSEDISNYDSQKPTAILIHDHQGHFRDEFSTTVREAFLKNHEVNVIVMDWAFVAGNEYLEVIEDLSFVSQDLFNFLEVLRKYKEVNVNNEDIHLIGFGMGAHIAGEVGNQALNVARIARITALDPSGRNSTIYNHILSIRDARYVESIHTDGGALGFGIGSRVAHVDFFANRGANQPICLTNICNHNRAWQLFAASLEYDHLIGNRCINREQVSSNTCRGFALAVGGAELMKVPMLPGIYRVNTGRNFPFRLNENTQYSSQDDQQIN